ncbi:MAG: hypothetical protein AAGH78_05170 [Cyanobacteria bacterium P01_H01_bin.58]
MMCQQASFSVEVVDGDRLGRLWVPTRQIADWINFLATPHYRAEIVSAEQVSDCLSLYFEASEGLYTYLEAKLNPSTQLVA